MINDSTWWVTGGARGGYLTSDIYTSEKGWQPYVSFPYPGASHGMCNLQLNETHYFMTGGYQREDVHIADITNLDTVKFHEMESTHDMGFASCGFITRTNGVKEILLAAGNSHGKTNRTDIFSLEDLGWRRGPDLPKERNSSRGVQLEKTILVIGGEGSDGSIFKFEPENDSWIELPQKLSFSKRLRVAFPVQDDAVNCS